MFESISQGVVSVGDDIFLLKGFIKGDKFFGFSDKTNKSIILESGIVKPVLKGEDVTKYSPLKNHPYPAHWLLNVDLPSQSHGLLLLYKCATEYPPLLIP